ncbi:maltose acetyltransferase domain-containing protein [uncultured Veillonella sp.]|uniref:maltose acetyltransferase domain-containing protein n=1 Tax=uncultured Veillonella sp. TaxID=159268 RepID=UPI00259A2B3F|nr:maltose acetyltransferase domain-containing protein [uncultured Veillonella sp.]
MTEHEKLLAGLDYDYRDDELQTIMKRTVRQVSDLNNSLDPLVRVNILRTMLGHMGSNIVIKSPVRFTYGVHTSLGNDVFINDGCNFLDSNRIMIGNRVLIGPDTKLYCGEHALDASQRFVT